MNCAAPTDAGDHPGSGRGVAYAVLAELWGQGLTARVRDHVAAVPSLAPHANACPDELAVRHQRVLRHEVFPHEGVFLRPDGLAGEGDHVARQLDALAQASGRQEACQLLEDHLLLWLPGLALAVAEEEDPLFTGLAEWTLEVVDDHASEVGARARALPRAPGPPDLAAADTSLGDVVDFLLTPIRCGLFVSRAAIGRAGRSSGAPRGFGPRRTMLTNLLQSATAYGGLREATDTLRDMIERARDAHADRPGGPAWRERLAHSDALIAQLGTTAAV